MSKLNSNLLARPIELSGNATLALSLAERSIGTPQEEKAMLMALEFLGQAYERVSELRQRLYGEKPIKREDYDYEIPAPVLNPRAA